MDRHTHINTHIEIEMKRERDIEIKRERYYIVH